MNQRTIKFAYTPKFHQGFLGKGHAAAAVIDGQHFPQTDPFFLLMDDQLDLPGGRPLEERIHTQVLKQLLLSWTVMIKTGKRGVLS